VRSSLPSRNETRASRPSRASRALVAGLALAAALAFDHPVRGDAEAPAPAKDAVTLAADRLEADARRWGGRAAIVALDAATGRVIVDRQGRAPMNPASNAKLVTAAAALTLLGPQHRFVTGLYGAMDRDGEVRELVLRGQGDPSLATADLFELARQAREDGLVRVGSIAVDQSYFDDRFTPPAFDEQPGEWAPFRAPVSAVPLDENTMTFTFVPGSAGERAKVRVTPPGLVDVTGTVRTTKRREPESIELSLTPSGTRVRATIGGHLAEGSAAHAVRRLDDPRLAPGLVLRSLLEQLGVKVSGDVRLGGEKATRALAVHRSAPLAELLTALGKRSDNFYAETIFKAIGAETKGRPGTAEAGALAVTDVLRRLGALDDGVAMRNGSGLFHGATLTTHALATVLRTAWADPAIGPDYVAQLAIGGVDGTLRGRFRSWADTRAVRAKTGTLNAVASLSGYVLAPDGGSPVVFSIVVNDVSGHIGPARADMDRVVDALARARWGDRAPAEKRKKKKRAEPVANAP
jgi:D-alanyl-D-alanine carboxypeptidase/D-alanyl-D-alanine-endopeptidase (penicillin-binding protein 4)